MTTDETRAPRFASMLISRQKRVAVVEQRLWRRMPEFPGLFYDVLQSVKISASGAAFATTVNLI